jgi:hypothetical protein
MPVTGSLRQRSLMMNFADQLLWKSRPSSQMCREFRPGSKCSERPDTRHLLLARQPIVKQVSPLGEPPIGIESVDSFQGISPLG